jgi:3-methyladenine DNA glycosylase Tag
MKVVSWKETWQPQEWIYRKTHPPSDDAYFENMTHVIFQAGLSWKMIEKRWPNFKKAFENFSIDRVAGFNEDDIKRLMTDSSIVRNRRKILAAIQCKAVPKN